jgi:hypothetical protein
MKRYLPFDVAKERRDWNWARRARQGPQDRVLPRVLAQAFAHPRHSLPVRWSSHFYLNKHSGIIFASLVLLIILDHAPASLAATDVIDGVFEWEFRTTVRPA